MQTWGITISSTILQNGLKQRLPEDFVNAFPAGIEIAYAAIPLIPALQEPLKGQVREAFASSLSMVWKVMAGIAVAGFLCNFALQELPMSASLDEKYGLRESQNTETLVTGHDGNTSLTSSRL